MGDGCFAREARRDVDDDWTDEELRAYADTYGRLGFFDVKLKLRPILTQSRIDATGAFYSPTTRSITFIGAPRGATVIHEYVHALQDQHFDIIQSDHAGDGSDGFLARRALLEGDAELAANQFLSEEQGGGLDTVDYDQLFERWIRYSAKYLDDSPYPLIFRAYTSFVYTYGLIYSATNLFGSSPLMQQPAPPPYPWDRQDVLFTARRPAKTAEILRAVSAPGGSALVDIGIPGGLADDLELVNIDTLGAWYTYLLFRPVPDPPSLLDLAGDRVMAVRDTTTGDVGVLWISAWQSEQSAAMAAEALRALHATTDEPVVIERRQLRVVLARNFAADITPGLVDATFTGTASAPRIGGPPLHVREAIRHFDCGAARHAPV